MGRARQLLNVAALLLVTALVTAACTSVHLHRDVDPHPVVVMGPPPHAPAHGYRTTNLDGSVIVFDASLGCYQVVGWTDVYFYDSHYYRVHDGRWERSMRIDRGWGPPGHAKVPPGLQRNMAKDKGKDKGKDSDDQDRSREGKGKSKGKGRGQ